MSGTPAFCLLASLVLGASESDRVQFPSRKIEGHNTVACENFDIEGRCVTVLTRRDGGPLVTAEGALWADAGVILCRDAAPGQGGCLTVGTQTLAGAKTWSGAQTYSASVDLQANSVVRGDLLFLPPSGGFFQQLTSNAGWRFIGNKSGDDVSAEFRIDATNYRDAGYMLDLYDSRGNRVFAVDLNGAVWITGPEGAENSGQLIDATGVAGHVMMTALPGYNVTIAGKFDAPTAPEHDATLLDGGMAPDGGFFPYGGRHGEVTLSASYPRYGGQLVDVINPRSGTGALTDKVFGVDYEGGIFQLHGLNLAQFGPCPIVSYVTTFGQYVYGHDESALMYANDQHRWYFCNGTAWTAVALQSEIQALQNRLTDAGIP